jgi:hypothetical protein
MLGYTQVSIDVLRSTLSHATPTKGLFGSVAIHWMARDIHFFSGYPVFGLEEVVDRDSQIQRIYPQKCG